jgi:hypothetical protein
MNPGANRQGLVVVDAALALIAIVLIVQMWLLSATLEAFLAGRRSVVIPAAIVSILLAAACAALGAFVSRQGKMSK